MHLDKVTDEQLPKPPRPYGRRQPWPDLAAALKESPGEWFKLTELGYKPRMVQVTASRIRNGKMAAFTPAGMFEARHDWHSIWVRYVGN